MSNRCNVQKKKRYITTCGRLPYITDRGSLQSHRLLKISFPNFSHDLPRRKARQQTDTLRASLATLPANKTTSISPHRYSRYGLWSKGAGVANKPCACTPASYAMNCDRNHQQTKSQRSDSGRRRKQGKGKNGRKKKKKIDRQRGRTMSLLTKSVTKIAARLQFVKNISVLWALKNTFIKKSGSCDALHSVSVMITATKIIVD